ncbi:hypothetical protein [Rubripirellula amarantea]|nr:hypothetical protein [Rubripirellula amarantea]
MSAQPYGPRYLMRWDFCRNQMSDRQWVRTSHRLSELPSFSDAGLADLINGYPENSISVESTAHNPSHPSERQLGQLGGLSGQQVIALLPRGKFSVVLRNLHRHSVAIGHITNRLIGEMMECSRLLRIRSFAADLHLNSAGSQSYLRGDVRPSVQWGIRGEQTILRYPDFPAITDQAVVERVVNKDWDKAYRTPLYHEPMMEQHCKREPLGADSLVIIPQYSPHRVIQGNTLGATLVMRFETDQSRMNNQVQIANDWLRKRLGREVSDRTDGWLAAAKRVIANRLMKESGSRQNNPRPASFRLNENAEGGMESLTEPALKVPSSAQPAVAVTMPTELNATPMPLVLTDLMESSPASGFPTHSTNLPSV